MPCCIGQESYSNQIAAQPFLLRIASHSEYTNGAETIAVRESFREGRKM